MEAPHDSGVPTLLIYTGTVLVWVFQNFFLVDLMNTEVLTTFNWAMLVLGYLVEIATAVLVVIRLYEKREYFAKISKKIKKFFKIK